MRVPSFLSSGLHVNNDKTLTKLTSSFIFENILEQSFKMLCGNLWPKFFLFEVAATVLLPLPSSLRISPKTTTVFLRENDKILRVPMHYIIKTSIAMLFQVQKCFMTTYQVHIRVKYNFHFRHQCIMFHKKNHTKQ